MNIAKTETAVCGGSNLKAPMKLDFLRSLCAQDRHVWPEVVLCRVEGFGFLPVTCFTMALTTFVSQNLGAKAYDRVKKGIRVGIFCSVTIAETIALLIFIFSPKLIGLFTSDAQSIAFGVMHERTCWRIRTAWPPSSAARANPPCRCW